MKNIRKIMIVAGEASGDGHAAKLVNALRAIEPDTDFDFFGAAGPAMRSAGVRAVVQADELSIVGLAEIGRALPMFLRAARELKKAAIIEKPDVAILIDFPEFNLKVARTLKKQGIRVVYYISPQLWAWRKYRIGTVRKYIDLMLTILPFERDWYARRGVGHVEYVGSPLVREVHPDKTKADFCHEHGLDPAAPVIGLLPGSRHTEIVRILPVMIAAAAEIAATAPDTQFLIAAADERTAAEITRILGKRTFAGERLKVICRETYDLINAADAAAVASGTATLEAGIIGTPMVVVYRTSRLNYKLFEPIIDVPHYGLINLIAEERLAKELIQDEFTSSNTAAELIRLLDPSENASMRERLKLAVGKLGHGGASRRAAEAILRVLS